MTKALITGSSPLKAWKDLVRLVLTSGYPFQTFINTPVTRIQLRTINGRRRSYPCHVHVRKAIPKAASPRHPTPPRSRSSRSSSLSSARSSISSSSPKKPKSPPVRSGRLTKWPSTTRRRRGSNGKSKSPAKASPYSSPLGLNNPGVYCYRRALLQCLLHLPALYNELVDNDIHSECDAPNGECIACAFKAFVFAYWNDRSLKNFPPRREGGVLSTLDEAVNDLCSESSMFHDYANSYVQGDAYEFFTHLTDSIKETDEELYRAIDRPFEVTHVITRTCPHCGDQEVNEQSNTDITVAARRRPKGAELSLVDYLDEFHNELVPVTCKSEVCVSRRMTPERDLQLGVASPKPAEPGHERTFRISKAPAALVVNLKRAQFNVVRQRAFKVHDDIAYEEELDLTAFTEDGETLKYRLYGVVAHAGDSPVAGHWIAAVRQRDGTTYRTISDSSVAPVEPAEVGFDELRYPFYNEELFDSTVLLYLKVEDEEE